MRILSTRAGKPEEVWKMFLTFLSKLSLFKSQSAFSIFNSRHQRSERNYLSLKITSIKVYSVASEPAITLYLSTPLLSMLTSLKTFES